MISYLEGNEVESNQIFRTQVYLATHDGAGNSLPYMNKSFISFTYGGKAIEDFNLIATISDRLEYNLYAPFTDITSTYDMLDGQIYWGSKLEANQLALTLSTDGITEQQLNEFKSWFSPGVERELILAERPNRAILARVMEKPVFSCLPFGTDASIVINGQTYKTQTTLYKGSITLTFVMDDPYWYSKLNYMPYYLDKKTFEILNENSENNNKIVCLEDKDMIKIMIEDGIPYQNNLTGDYFLGGNLLVTAEARVDFSSVGSAYLGTITTDSEGLTVNSNNPAYLFYSGNTKSYPIIKFSMELQFENNYIIKPTNKVVNSDLEDDEYSYIQIGDNKLKFTTSSILTSYNEAIKIFSNISDNNNLTEGKKVSLMEEIRDKVTEYYARAWAIDCINTQTNKDNLLSRMRSFFNDSTVTFIINSKTGEAIGFFDIKERLEDGNISSSPNIIQQNVGDMIRSDYLIIEGKDYLNNNGEIINCHQITTNENLVDFLVFYKNMYL